MGANAKLIIAGMIIYITIFLVLMIKCHHNEAFWFAAGSALETIIYKLRQSI